jgi:hypothetical protein
MMQRLVLKERSNADAIKLPMQLQKMERQTLKIVEARVFKVVPALSCRGQTTHLLVLPNVTTEDERMNRMNQSPASQLFRKESPIRNAK